MKTITKPPIIDRARLHELVEYDAQTGLFSWRVRTSNRVSVGSPAGTRTNHGYVRISLDGRKYYAHQLAWLYVYGVWPSEDIDHIDQDRANNRIANLRAVSRADNLKNRRRQKNNTSGVTGVCWSAKDQRWVAQIGTMGRPTYLGQFKEKEDAITVRRQAETQFGFHENHGRAAA